MEQPNPNSNMVLLRRTTGTFVPVSQHKQVHERKVVLPVLWHSPSLHAAFQHTDEILEYALQLDSRSLLVACASKVVAVLMNPRASYLFNAAVFGDVFILVKQWTGACYQTLDFTMEHLQVFIARVHSTRKQTLQYPFTVPFVSPQQRKLLTGIDVQTESHILIHCSPSAAAMPDEHSTSDEQISMPADTCDQQQAAAPLPAQANCTVFKPPQ